MALWRVGGAGRFLEVAFFDGVPNDLLFSLVGEFGRVVSPARVHSVLFVKFYLCYPSHRARLSRLHHRGRRQAEHIVEAVVHHHATLAHDTRHVVPHALPPLADDLQLILTL